MIVFSVIFLYFMFLYFILWAAVSAAYSALLSSSYFERINDDDDDDEKQAVKCISISVGSLLTLAVSWPTDMRPLPFRHAGTSDPSQQLTHNRVN